MPLKTHKFVSGLTNSEIVDIVYRTFTIRSLINKMISNSSRDKSNDDLEQYIYLTMLQLPNEKLLKMYNDGKLRNWCSQVIQHQRDNGSFYRRVRLKDNIDPFITEAPMSEQDFLPDLLYSYIKSRIEFNENTEYTETQIKELLAFTLLDKFICSKRSMRQMSKTLGISRKTIAVLIEFAKNETVVWYNDYGQYYTDEYIKKIYGL